MKVIDADVARRLVKRWRGKADLLDNVTPHLPNPPSAADAVRIAATELEALCDLAVEIGE